MKRSFIFASSLALLMGVAVAAGAQQRPVNEAKAVDENPVSGYVTLDMTWNWADYASGQYFSVYFFDDTDSENVVSGWGDYVFSGHNVQFAKISYDLPFTPVSMIAVRYGPDKTKEAWEAQENKFDGKWNQTVNLTFEENPNIVIEKWNEEAGANEASVIRPRLEGKPYNDEWNAWGTIATFYDAKANGANHCEYFLTKNFVEWEEFGLKLYDTDWVNAFTLSPYLEEGCFENGNNNIICKSGGTYSLYYDHSTNTIYISDPVSSEADEWAQIFLGIASGSDNCTYTKDHWAECKTLFENLEYSAARELLMYEEHFEPEDETDTYIKKAVQRYDYVLTLYGSSKYEDFLERVGTYISSQPINMMRLNGEVASTMIIVVGVLALTATIGVSFMMIRKRKTK